MIVIESFPPIEVGAEGRAIHIDADRRIVAFVGKGIALHFHNGTERQSIALTLEAAESLLVLLADVLGDAA